jgi:hypothetical protein
MHTQGSAPACNPARALTLHIAELVAARSSRSHTCIVTSLSSTCTSLVKKSAPIVALYWLLNFLLTYWFIREVFPTLHGTPQRYDR